MASSVNTMLMFTGQAEQAMTLYTSCFENSRIVAIERYGKEGPGPEGSVYHAVFTLDGTEFQCIDSPVKHGFTFTPSISMCALCKTEAEIDRLFATLSEGGGVLMPLQAYPFARKFAWVSDRFGVSWQLKLTGE